MRIVVNGIALEVELKDTHGTPSDLQKRNVQQINYSGGLAFILYPEGFETFKDIVKGGDNVALRLSHSRVDCFNRCPFKYQMRYVDRIGTIPNTDPDNALILGTALHTGIEEGVAQALEFYQNSFPVLTDEHINEMIKLEALIPKAAALLPPVAGLNFPLGTLTSLGSWTIWPRCSKIPFLG